MIRLITLLISCAFTGSFIAQINVVHEPIIPYFLSEVVGDGTVVSSVTVNGVDFNMINLQAGTFTGGGDLGIGSGIILGTGNVGMAMQTNTGGGNSLQGSGDNYTDSDLESLTTVSVNDQIMLDFDFVANGGEVFMNYVLASEEYPEFACSNFNDVIGVFLSGPNPDGGEYVNLNIARVPSPNDISMFTDAPVAINSINDGMNGDEMACLEIAPNYLDYTVFYVSNEGGTYEYDGRTVLLPIRWPVVPGETYHMKMGIGDGSDTAYDSAFLLQAQSFRTTSPPPSDIAELSADEVSIFPNPASDKLTIRSTNANVHIASMVIQDMQGKVLQSENWAQQQTDLDLRGLEGGVYLLSIRSVDGRMLNKRITVK